MNIWTAQSQICKDTNRKCIEQERNKNEFTGQVKVQFFCLDKGAAFDTQSHKKYKKKQNLESEKREKSKETSQKMPSKF